MALASGIKKVSAFKKQSALGTAASGSGGSEFRRTQAVINASRDMYENNEIQSHHMSTGSNFGLQKGDFKGDIELSPGTYSLLVAGLVEKDFAAVSAGAAAAATTVAFVSGFTYTVTRGAGSFLTDGLKAGLVVRITGSGVHANNINKNLLIISVTALICTVYVLNNTAMTAEGPLGNYVLTVVGKVAYTPTTGHTNDYFTVEDWYSDVSKSETLTDAKVGGLSLSLPASGNATGSFTMVGLGRTVGTSQVLTSPTASTTGTVAAINGFALVNGVLQTALTSMTLNIDKGAANSGAVVGSNVGSDVNTGRVKVTGSLTAQFDSTTLRDLVISETVVPIDIVMMVDETATSEFISFSIPAVKLTSDTPDDGEKTIIRTYNFVAQYNSTGGAALARINSIIQVQDSAA